MRKKTGLIFLLLLSATLYISLWSQQDSNKEVKKEEIKITEFKDVKDFLSAKPTWYNDITIKPLTSESPARGWKDIKTLEMTGTNIKEMMKYCYQYLETYSEPVETNKLAQRDALSKIADYYFLLEDYPKAIETNILILKLFQEPLYVILKAKYNIAECYVKLGEKEKALKILKEATALFPEPKAFISPQQESYTSAITNLIDLIENPPKITFDDFLKDRPEWIKEDDLIVRQALNSDVLFAQIVQAKRENKPTESIMRMCYLYLKVFPKSNQIRIVKILLDIGDAYNSINDYKRAGNAYQLIGITYPKWEYGVVLSYDKMAQNYLDQKKPEEAVKVWEECLAKYGNATGASMGLVKEMKLKVRDLKNELEKNADKPKETSK